MEQSPYQEINGRSGSQEILCLRYPNVHYRVHKSLPLDPILSRMNPVHILTPFFFKINFNIIPTSKPRSPKLSLSFMFSVVLVKR